MMVHSIGGSTCSSNLSGDNDSGSENGLWRLKEPSQTSDRNPTATNGDSSMPASRTFIASARGDELKGGDRMPQEAPTVLTLQAPAIPIPLNQISDACGRKARRQSITSPISASSTSRQNTPSSYRGSPHQSNSSPSCVRFTSQSGSRRNSLRRSSMCNSVGARRNSVGARRNSVGARRNSVGARRNSVGARRNSLLSADGGSRRKSLEGPSICNSIRARRNSSVGADGLSRRKSLERPKKFSSLKESILSSKYGSGSPRFSVGEDGISESESNSTENHPGFGATESEFVADDNPIAKALMSAQGGGDLSAVMERLATAASSEYYQDVEISGDVNRLSFFELDSVDHDDNMEIGQYILDAENNRKHLMMVYKFRANTKLMDNWLRRSKRSGDAAASSTAAVKDGVAPFGDCEVPTVALDTGERTCRSIASDKAGGYSAGNYSAGSMPADTHTCLQPLRTGAHAAVTCVAVADCQQVPKEASVLQKAPRSASGGDAGAGGTSNWGSATATSQSVAYKRLAEALMDRVGDDLLSISTPSSAKQIDSATGKAGAADAGSALRAEVRREIDRQVQVPGTASRGQIWRRPPTNTKGGGFVAIGGKQGDIGRKGTSASKKGDQRRSKMETAATWNTTSMGKDGKGLLKQVHSARDEEEARYQDHDETDIRKASLVSLERPTSATPAAASGSQMTSFPCYMPMEPPRPASCCSGATSRSGRMRRLAKEFDEVHLAKCQEDRTRQFDCLMHTHRQLLSQNDGRKARGQRRRKHEEAIREDAAAAESELAAKQQAALRRGTVFLPTSPQKPYTGNDARGGAFIHMHDDRQDPGDPPWHESPQRKKGDSMLVIVKACQRKIQNASPPPSDQNWQRRQRKRQEAAEAAARRRRELEEQIAAAQRLEKERKRNARMFLSYKKNPELFEHSADASLLHYARTGDLVALVESQAAQMARPQVLRDAFFAAAQHGSLDVLTYLVEKVGCSVHWQEAASLRTALHFTAEANHVNCCAMLQEAKANISARDRTGRRPDEVAGDVVAQIWLSAGRYLRLQEDEVEDPLLSKKSSIAQVAGDRSTSPTPRSFGDGRRGVRSERV